MHIYHTRRNGKKVWFGRRIERPSGRLLVLHSRTTWTLSLVIWGGYSVAYSVVYWLVYAKEYSQRPLIVMRSFQGIPLFLGGWCVSWSGLQVRLALFDCIYSSTTLHSTLQAFMLATESANEVVLPVPVANTLCLAGGIVNILIVIVRTSLFSTTFDFVLTKPPAGPRHGRHRLFASPLRSLPHPRQRSPIARSLLERSYTDSYRPFPAASAYTGNA